MKVLMLVTVAFAVALLSCGKKEEKQESIDGLWKLTTETKNGRSSTVSYLYVTKYENGKLSNYSVANKAFVNSSGFRIDGNKIVLQLQDFELSRVFSRSGNSLIVIRNSVEQHTYLQITEEEFRQAVLAAEAVQVQNPPVLPKAGSPLDPGPTELSR